MNFRHSTSKEAFPCFPTFERNIQRKDVTSIRQNPRTSVLVSALHKQGTTSAEISAITAIETVVSVQNISEAYISLSKFD